MKGGKVMQVPDFLLSFIKEDAPFGDTTSEAIIDDLYCRAIITAREPGVIAGLAEAAALFQHFGVAILNQSTDGSEVAAGTIVMSVEGPARGILLVERTALNIIGRMSGIATKTRKMSAMIQSVNSSCRISATRKTAPGLRLLDKKAVRLGGGDPHRMSLSDGILIKDNHLALVPLATAIRRARERSCYQKIEIEVSSPADALSAALAGADILLLDNMTPALVRQVLQLCEGRGVRDNLIIEVSGNIDETNVLSYAIPGVDRISSGFLTHSVRNYDVSLDIMKQ
jgi:nicotinate-nucleotide pyrophosphorylase (carboxylating)